MNNNKIKFFIKEKVYIKEKDFNKAVSELLFYSKEIVGEIDFGFITRDLIKIEPEIVNMPNYRLVNFDIALLLKKAKASSDGITFEFIVDFVTECEEAIHYSSSNRVLVGKGVLRNQLYYFPL